MAGVWDHADMLAAAVNLDMSGYWMATVAIYTGRVTNARIGEAVREAMSEEAAERIGGLKKPDMASQAEALLAGKGWLPPVLRTGTAPVIGYDAAAHDDGYGEPEPEPEPEARLSRVNRWIPACGR